MIQFLGDEQYAKEFLERVNKHIDDHGFVIFATELKETSELICFVGLAIPSFEAHFTPCVEIGWRLSSKHWGKG